MSALHLDGFILRVSKIKVMKKFVNDESDVDANNDPEVDPLSVYIGNLDKRITSSDLTQFLHQAGTTTKVTVLKNKDTGEHKGAAYAQFMDRESMNRALGLDGCFVGGKYVKIRRKRKTVSGSEDEPSGCNKRIKTEQFEDEDPKIHEVSSIYVGSLNQRTGKDDLEKYFKNFGDVVRVSILKGKRSAYIEFKESGSVQGALSLNGSRLMDSDITVQRKLLKVS